MGIVDIIIILFILLGGLSGFRDGVFKKLATTVGIVLVVVVSFMLKSKVSFYFYENLPFLDLWGIFKGIQALNVVFYEVVAFLVIASILYLIYSIILAITGLIEKILKATVILSIPSKILGFFVGLVENYMWAYVILFVLTLPIVNVKEVYSSKLASYIMENTQYVSKYKNKTIDVYNDVYKVIKEKDEKSNKEINREAMDLMLKYDVLTVESAEKLIESNKVAVDEVEFLEKYRVENTEFENEENEKVKKPVVDDDLLARPKDIISQDGEEDEDDNEKEEEDEYAVDDGTLDYNQYETDEED